MNSEKSTNAYDDCSSKYSKVMGMIYNIENNVERMMKTKEATFKYNDCLYFKGKMKNKTQIIPTSNR